MKAETLTGNVKPGRLSTRMYSGITMMLDGTYTCTPGSTGTYAPVIGNGCMLTMGAVSVQRACARSRLPSYSLKAMRTSSNRCWLSQRPTLDLAIENTYLSAAQPRSRQPKLQW